MATTAARTHDPWPRLQSMPLSRVARQKQDVKGNI